MMLTFFIICLYINYHFGMEGFSANQDQSVFIGSVTIMGLLLLGLAGSIWYAFYGPSQIVITPSNPVNSIINWGTTKNKVMSLNSRNAPRINS